MRLIDSHCHLNYDYTPKNAEDLIREAGEAGVIAMVTVGTEVATIPALEALSSAYPNVFHTVGVHPHDAAQISPQDYRTLEKAAGHPKCVAIGEIGLDYYYEHSARDIQCEQLDQQLELALVLRKPVVIHSRDAEPDLLAALTRYAKRSSTATGVPGIIHCFSGTQAFGQACLDLGFMISFSGILTFKTADSLRIAAKAFPLERLLVETDSPYLSPVPFRGKKCEPRMVAQTAQKLAEVKGLTFEEVARVTTANAIRTLGLPLDQT